MTISLQELPNEVLFQIFVNLPPTSAPALQQVSRRFKDVSQQLLWRHYCREYFTSWSPEHRIQERYTEPVNATDWKTLFAQRHQIDRQISWQFEDLLSSQIGRIAVSEGILSNGYDAKDTLVKHLQVDVNTLDGLARRYYSKAILSSLRRRVAVSEWVRLLEKDDVSLERALGAFDMFVLKGKEGDLDDISRTLNDLQARFCQEYPEHEEMTPRLKCTAIAEFLRSRSLVGIRGNVNAHYHNLQNNFIGVALHDPEHSSLPLITVAIYCCLAQRLGLDALPCGFPFHVIAIVKPSDQTMDGRPPTQEQPLAPLYMDPFRSSFEADIGDLKSQLVSLGIQSADHAKYLDASPIAEIVRRCAKNIITSVQSLPRDASVRRFSLTRYIPDVDDAFYGALWALALFVDGDSANADLQRHPFLSYIVQQVDTLFQYDCNLVERHLFSQVRDPDQYRGTLQMIRESDTKKETKGRWLDPKRTVRYKVGDYFQHKRYNYRAVITGWDTECRASREWIAQMRVNEQLSRGQHQTFYHAQVEDGSTRYVAEDNITVVTTDPAERLLLSFAGKYFKRWDAQEGKFISNIKDEYPDD